jgi:hypothetical protein
MFDKREKNKIPSWRPCTLCCLRQQPIENVVYLFSCTAALVQRYTVFEYCLKIYIFRKQFHVTKTQENAYRNTCIFIISAYNEKWFYSHVAIEVPYQDILFIQSLINYENIEKQISNITLKK